MLLYSQVSELSLHALVCGIAELTTRLDIITGCDVESLTICTRHLHIIRKPCVKTGSSASDCLFLYSKSIRHMPVAFKLHLYILD